MAKKIHSAKILPEKPEEKLPEKPEEKQKKYIDDIPEQKNEPLTTATPNPEKEKMEVHHHPDIHHKKKKFKEYFIEFFMIFLAVTMGFFAENYREGRVERTKEKEYIHSMIEDAETDIRNYDEALLQNGKRVESLDTLAKMCFNFDPADSSNREIYRVYRKCLRHPDLVSPVERTFMQLKNSGGMRLIENKIAIDSIVGYDDFGKKLTEQQTAYEDYLSKLLDKSIGLFNYGFYQNNTYLKRATTVFASDQSPTLIVNNKTSVTEFANQATLYKEIVTFYMVRLNEGKTHAENLIVTLKKEYDID